MHRVCRSCAFTTADLYTNGCPRCGTPLALMRVGGPPDAAPARPRATLVLAILLAVGGLAAGGLWYVSPPAEGFGPPAPADSTGRIREGMHVHRVARLLDPAPRNDEEPLTARLPPDSKQTGTLVWQRGERSLRVRFRGGYVTTVEDGPGGPDRCDLDFE